MVRGRFLWLPSFRRLTVPLLLFFLSFFYVSVTVQAQTVEDGYAAFDAGDFPTARDIFLKLSEQGDLRAMNAMGVYYVNSGSRKPDRALACDWYERAAKKGYGPGQYNYANCFSTPGGRTKNINAWHTWLLKAARSGHQTATETLLSFYLTTKNTKLSEKLAREGAQADYKVSRIALWILGKSDENIDAIYCDFKDIKMLNIPQGYCAP